MTQMAHRGISEQHSGQGNKNAWRGMKRVVPLGPKAIAIVREFLGPHPAAYLFAPRQVVAECRANGIGGRPEDLTAACYTRRTYGTAIARGCDRAFPHTTLSAIPRRR